MLPLASTSIPISQNSGASGNGGGRGGGHCHGSGGGGSGRQAPPPPLVVVEPKAIHHSRWAGGCNTEDIPLALSQ